MQQLAPTQAHCCQGQSMGHALPCTKRAAGHDLVCCPPAAQSAGPSTKKKVVINLRRNQEFAHGSPAPQGTPIPQPKVSPPWQC